MLFDLHLLYVSHAAQPVSNKEGTPKHNAVGKAALIETAPHNAAEITAIVPASPAQPVAAINTHGCSHLHLFLYRHCCMPIDVQQLGLSGFCNVAYGDCD